jgi:DNA-binding NarL/FixJ family response regulator
VQVPPDISRYSISVLIADSNQTHSQLLNGALRRQRGLKVACCRGELSQCLEALQSRSADIVLLGDRPSDHDRLADTIRGVHSAYPNVGLVLLVDSYDRSLVVNAMRAGARGLFCRASQPVRALCRCISVVHRGQYWASTEQIGFIIDALNSNLSTRLLNAKGEQLLTEREQETVNLVAEGLGNREVAQLLCIKENSVKKSVLRIYDKLGVSNRVELVLYALTHRGECSSPSPPPVRVAVPGIASSRVGVLGGLDIHKAEVPNPDNLPRRPSDRGF